MDVRRLATAQERFEARQISIFAFHVREADPEKIRERCERDADKEEWGAFDENGRMMARIVNHHYETWLDGTLVPNGGIGGVSTWPEDRNRGCIREIFSRLLPEARRRGEIISTLYPFNHAFYRRFGYETVRLYNAYEFPPAVLRGYRFDGKAEMWKPGDSLEAYTALYNHMAEGYNLSMRREERTLLETQLKKENDQDRIFAYLLREEETPVAYLLFRDLYHNPMAILQVTDLAWNGRAGLRAILGFLGRFTADYGTIRLELPVSLDLLSVLQSPMAYEVQETAAQNYMVRAVNAEKLLSVIRKPAGCRFVIRVEGDAQIPENNGTWEVTAGSVAPSEKAPDLTVSIQALGQMAIGSVSLEEARYRTDVTVSDNEQVLEQVFRRKPIFVQEHF